MRTYWITVGLFLIIIGLSAVFLWNRSAVVTETNTKPTPTSAYEGTPVLPNTESVNLYFVALEDNGQQGQMIGCNDSLVSVITEIPTEGDQIQSALEKLLAVNEQTYQDTELYNSLSQSSLSVDSISVENAVAEVKLSGEVVASGVCDNPRIENQLKQTVLQFPEVGEAQIFINGQLLENVLMPQSAVYLHQKIKAYNNLV